MLGIILFILKLIGIVLLCILGLILAVVLIVLLVPVRYQAELEVNPERKANGYVRVNWLLHLFRFRMQVRENQPDIQIKLLWFSLSGKEKKAAEQAAQRAEEAAEEEVESLAKELEEEWAEPIEQAGENEPPSQGESKAETGEKAQDLDSDKDWDRKSEKNSDESSEGNSDKNSDREARAHIFEKSSPSWFEKIQSRCGKFCSQIKQMVALITDKKITLEQKLAALQEKWNQLKEVWHDLRVQRALAAVKKQLKKLLHRIAPKKFWLKLHVGLSDVALLGEITAVMAWFYPTFGERIVWQPDFEQEILEGSTFIKGKICLGSFVRVLLALAVRKDVRYTINEVKKFRSAAVS